MATEHRKGGWSKIRILRLLSNAYFDLFTIKGYEPSPKDLKKWLEKYMKRETLPEDRRGKHKRKKDVPIQGKNN